MQFQKFKEAIRERFKKMTKSADHLFITGVSKDKLWEKYLDSFPDGSNPIYKERTEHDCQCCKQFIRNYGRIVTITKMYNLVSIWDIHIGGEYQEVADAMSKFVRDFHVSQMFICPEKDLGTNASRQLLDDNKVKVWEHFHLELPSKFVFTGQSDSIGTVLSDRKANKDVLKRGLAEITQTSIETVLDLIKQNALYRGEEHTRTLNAFLKLKKKYKKVGSARKDDFCWLVSAKIESRSKLRNTAIGTLLIDISNNVAIESAVRKFEKMVAPENYKRPNAILTPKMIADAKAKIEELGFTDSLSRRYAVMDDITINNVIFANRDTKKAMNVFDELEANVPLNPKQFKRVQEVDIDTFLEEILPGATKLELLVENKHQANFVSLIAPEIEDSKSMFNWDSGYSWTYIGEVTDSIKQRVKNAGGDVDGVLRCSLSWYNRDDLDIHVIEPSRNRIHYGSRQNNATSGLLDVDMNANGKHSLSPVENITWGNEMKMLEGRYELIIHQYTKRDSKDHGFEVEIEYNGEIHNFAYTKPVKSDEAIKVAIFHYSRKNGLEIIESIESSTASKEIWGLNTMNFQNVSMLMNSPNRWDDKGVGNLHYFFMLEGCNNPEESRGFFNEFLNSSLLKHKRVFEALGSKMMAEPTETQLSGLGFSSTKRASVVCRVDGSEAKVVKINF